MPLRGRSAYNPVSASDDADDLESRTTEIEATPPTVVNSTSNTDTRGDTTPTPNRLGRGNTYSRLPEVSTTKDDEQMVIDTTTSLVDTMEKESVSSEMYSDSDSYSVRSENKITVVVLDAAHKRFPIDVDPEWKVQTFKAVGAKVHKVAPPSQRLIFRGKMMDDSKTLKEMGICQNDAIIHLFPKPRVTLVTDSSVTPATTAGNDQESGGAHVPQIIIDQEEQQRRGQILVLGSYEIVEAQNNVRLLSLLLGTICVMRLLALLSIATGADEVPVYEDDIAPTGSGAGSGNHTDDGMYPHVDYEPRTWQNRDYFDLLVSSVGFFVARLGIKATHENTSLLATHYLIGTMVAGILWNIWNVLEFALFVKEESDPKDDDTAIPLTSEDFRTIALFTIIMPLGVWFLCCARAWQFRHLIEEAELEAAERIRAELNLSVGVQTAHGAGQPNARELDDLSSSDERPAIV